MHHAEIARAFETTLFLSMTAALGLGAHRALAAMRAPEVPHARARSRPALLLHPLAQFLLVCAVVYVNQVLFGAFILRAHGGSTAFISQYIPGEWFAIGSRDPFVQLAAQHVGDGRWLSPTLLRVQAFLELPFTMLAYLAVARLLGRQLYATLCRPMLLALASLAFSVTFSLVELSLPNPYTNDDLVLRAAACLLTPMYIAWICRVEERRSPMRATQSGPSGVLGLLAFLAGAGAISYVVLALYDAFLLYNLAHLPRYAPGIAVSLVVAAGASFVAPRVDAALEGAKLSLAPSLAMTATVSALRSFTLLFFVPSLTLRYWGAHESAALCGLLLIALGLAAGTASALRRSRRSVGGAARLVLAGGVALTLGGWAAHAAWSSAGPGMPELLLARIALSFLAVAITSFRAVEIALCWAPHETKAPADQA
jgi:hypothetical protein